MIAYIKGGQSLANAFLYEVVCDAAGRVLVENRVHESDLGCAASCLSLGWTELSNTDKRVHPSQKYMQTQTRSQSVFMWSKDSDGVLS